MKLAFCLFRYYPFGGLERDFLRIAQECQKRGHIIDVYTRAWEGIKPEGINVNVLHSNGFTNHARNSSFVKEFQKKLSNHSYDLIIGFNRMPGLDVYYAADVCYQQSVSTKHGKCYRLLPRYRVYSAFEKAVFNVNSKTEILLLVEHERNNFIKHYQTANERFHLVPPGIDSQRLPYEQKTIIRSALRKTLNITDDQKIILMVGSDFKRKGVDRALHAMAALPTQELTNTHLLIIGKGDTKSLLQQAKKLKIVAQVHLLGAKENIGEYMLAADILLHPARQETAGMVLLEALVAGLPVLVTENCGYAFHIKNANAGLIVPEPYNQRDLNEKLVTMLEETKLNHWAINARSYAEQEDLYSLPEYAADFFEKCFLKL